MSKVHTINISKAKGVTRPKRARRAITLIKRYVERHAKATPVIGQNLNKEIWSHGGKKIPTKIKVNINVEDDKAKTELFGHDFNEPSKEDLKKQAEEKTKKAKPSKEHKHETEKHDGTEDVPKEVKESKVTDVKEESKEAEEKLKAEKSITKETKHPARSESKE